MCCIDGIDVAKPSLFRGLWGIAAALLLTASASAHGEPPPISVPDARQTQIRIVPGLDEPLVPTGRTTAAEDRALDRAISTFRDVRAIPTDYAETARPFVSFLSSNPQTAWRMALQTNLGLGYYRAGYFTRALTELTAAWEAGRNAKSPQAMALADRAVGELARMHARVGHASELEDLLREVAGRHGRGPATELIADARESLWLFRNEPGQSFLCGPMALKNLLKSLDAEPEKIRAMDDARSTPSGFSLAQVSDLARAAGVTHTLVYRAAGSAVPVPSIVNWKVDHYAAIVGKENGRYHIQDPTFASGDLWISEAAIDEEASGYFLVPSSVDADKEWRVASSAEAQHVFGKGTTNSNSPGATTPGDKKLHPDTCPQGMCVANAHLMLASVNLSDVPVGYRPPKGPSALIRLTYNQREAFQPATFGFVNVGPKWTLNLLSWIQDDPASPGTNVVRYVDGGGAIDYRTGYSYDSNNGQFTPARMGGAVLVRIPAAGPAASYELRNRDGGKYVYARADGANVAPRRIFLTKIVDPAGNAMVLDYDAQLRLTSMTDATGRKTIFGYGRRSAPLSVTRITDPFGRYASLGYTADGYLASITDVMGMTSSFTYSGAGQVTSMTTPYGTTSFTFGEDVTVNSRFLTITDPLGQTERIEFRHQAPGIAATEPSSAPCCMSLINDYLDMRNTFHWDKHTYPITHTDYTKAKITHWLHGFYPDDFRQTSSVVESEKAPLEGRIWYAYPGQSLPIYLGSSATPVAIGRLPDNLVSQVELRELDQFGTLVQITDPVGRVTSLSYDASGIDVLSVAKRIGSTLQTVAAYTYNAQHRPLTYVDAARQTTRFDYNAAGQLTRTTDALGNVTTNSYDTLGRLTQITNANGLPQVFFTYDGMDRVATRTDSEGYRLSFAYDALDRLVEVRYPDATTTRYTYSRLDVRSVKDRLGRVTSYQYDANRQLTSMTDPLGLTIAYSYYETSALKQITDPRGNSTRWQVDLQSRPISKTYADGTVEAYAYESRTSRLKSITDALGQSKVYDYTTDDRVGVVSYPNSRSPTPELHFTYDASLPLLVQAQSVTNRGFSGIVNLAYHPVGALGALKLASESSYFGSGVTLSPVLYRYDALGRPASRSIDGLAEDFQYDSLGRLSSRFNGLGQLNFTYLGQTTQLATKQSTQGTGIIPVVIATQWNYLNNVSDRRLAEMNSVRSFSYRTRPETNITGVTEVGSATVQDWNYNYDAKDRLISAVAAIGGARIYTYDGADNLTSGAMAYNGVNQITSAQGRPFSYDAAGNLLDDGQRSFQWDAESRLIRVTTRSGNTTEMYYDGFGRRVNIVDTSGNSRADMYYTWCGDTQCKAQDESTRAVTRRYFAQGEMRPQNRDIYYSRDSLGSVRATLTTGGAMLESYDYEPYGSLNVTSKLDPAMTPPSDFGYADLFYHQKSGLYLTKYRAYDPDTGRWLSRDPVGESAGLNLYSYVGANPINRIDPLGEDWVYSQSTGQLTNTNTPGVIYGSGYSGSSDGGVNNPALQNVPNTGPLPQGQYSIQALQTNTTGSGTQLPASMRLVPDAGNTMYGRAGFLIHGGNMVSKTSSTGCIVLPPNVRAMIPDGGDTSLLVVP